jgi:hypothetical protein
VSSLRVNQIKNSLNKLFDGLIDLSDLSPRDSQLDLKRVSRQLAALAVLRATGCSPEEAGQSVCDGTADNGIDAIFHDATAGEVVIVQSKWIQSGSGEPSARDIGIFVEGVEDIIEQKLEAFNKHLHGRLSAIADAIATVGTTVKLLIVSTGKSDLANPAKLKLQKITDSLNGGDDIQKIASFEILGLAEVYSNLASGASHASIDIELTILDWSYLAAPFGAYFGTVDGVQLKSLWGQFGKRLVAKNIRHSLGSTEVNDGIRQTASTEPDRFWYYNNGITLVADEAQRAPANSASQKSGVFHFNGASIVNGAQTVSTLSTVDDDSSLGKLRVPVRVIMLKNSPPEFGAMVTRTNNLQNRVEGRDFVAQDPEQARLQSEMLMEGVDYQYLRGEAFIASPSSCELIEVVTALACATGDPSLAVQAKTAIGRFFSDIRRAPYKTIINSSLSGAYAFNTVYMQREIDRIIATRQKALERKSGAQHGVLVHGNRVLSAAAFRLSPANFHQPIAEFTKNFNVASLEEQMDRLIECFVTIIEREYPNRFLAVVFKSPGESKIVTEKAIFEWFG